MSSRPALFAALMLVAPASAAMAQDTPPEGGTVSPRLAGVLAEKGLEPIGVEIWTRPNAPAPRGAAEIEPEHYLASLQPGEIRDLAASGSIAYVAPADPIVAPDPVDEPASKGGWSLGSASKAVTPRRSADWPSGTGSGITIGVIDFGEVPATFHVAAQRKFGRPGTSAHGSAVLAILHRLAPQARLVFAGLSPTAATTSDVQSAALWLEAQGARIITFSGATYSNRRDGFAPIDRIVDAQAARGVLWVAASGNEARRSWSGLSIDRDGDGLVDIGAGLNAVTLTSNGPVTLTLTWDDWGLRGPPGGQWNIDLLVSDSRGRLLAAERTRRGPIGEPVKVLTLPKLAPGTYHIALPLRGKGPAVRVRLTATGKATYLSPAVPFGSIGNPATARGAIAVAAIDPASATTTAYSGQGPTADRRAKPEFGASGAGSGGDWGTSYSAPRIAALAARIWSNSPRLGAIALRAALERYSQRVARRSVLGEAPRWIDTRLQGVP